MAEKHGHMHHGKSSKGILNSDEVLKATGIKKDDKFLDAGCGDGYISIEASSIVGEEGNVYALDVYPESIKTVLNEIKARNIDNMGAVVADITKEIPLDNESVDIALMANVLHGFVAGNEVDPVIKNIWKVLKLGGVFAVIEFRKVESNRGPPFNVRISPEEVSEILKKYGFDIVDSQEIGEYHYIVKAVKNLE
jgi:ubiquinone/menaquinone biosynthesis C-methylase UbiE